VANSYLMLYSKPTLQKALSENPSLEKAVWKVLNSISVESMLEEGRVYGGGLHKMEPKELGNVPVNSIDELIQSVVNDEKQEAL